MSAPSWLTDGASEVRRHQIEKDWEYSRRAVRDARRFVAANKPAIDAEWDALPNPPRTLAAHQAEVRQRNPKLFAVRGEGS
jgi:hypothetical protein